MDRKLRKILTECIRELETDARDVEGCLQQRPERAAELRPHLELWSRLNAAPKAQPNLASQQRGRHQLLGALADMEKEQERRTTRFLTPVLVKAAAVVAGVALLAGGAAGASAALGGPNVPAEVLSTVGINKGSHDGGNAADAAQDGLDTAHDALDGGVDGLDIADQRANEAAQPGLTTAGEAPGQAEGAGDGPPESVPASGSVPDDANLPDPLPAGPKP